MFARLLALFVIVPALELYLLIKLGTYIGAAETFGIILVTGLVGSWLAKSQGLSVWRRFQNRLGSGALPGTELVDGLIVLVSGALLITPGVLTDVVGILGLVPATRAMIRRYLSNRFLPRLRVMGVRRPDSADPDVGNIGAANMGVGNVGAGKMASGARDIPNNGFTTTGEPAPNESRSRTESVPDVVVGGTPRRRPYREDADR